MDCSKLTEDGISELGMEFSIEDDAYKFYNKYAFKMGFSVRKNYLNKDKDGVTTSRRYSCCKECVKRTMKYRQHNLVLDYNHVLHIVQCSHMMPLQRKVSEVQGFQVEISEDARLSLKQNHELMGKEAGGMGNVGYARDDLKRYLRTRRERNLKYGETEVMCGKRPNTILTDQDHAMAAALSLVMLQTFHGLCTFHIRRNFMKYLGNHYKDNSDIPYMFGACMYEIEEVKQFNRVWESMVKKHNFKNNEWLTGLYRIPDKWARCMMKELWTVRIHFNRVVDDKRHNKLIAEYEMRQKLPMVGLRQTPIFVHAAEMYSQTVFITFQNEYGESTTMIILRQQRMFVEFAVMRYDGGPERIVVFNRNDLSVRFSCKKYENDEILCGHALKVFDTVGIKTISPEYVKRRWTKRVRARDCFDRRAL
ncbi:protein FAR1-RELATED SEQUENCE 5-like [Coffea arabica]|uniref:Protein FAR1-RELATED SEQUENCE 5-like n=1 Tax=Coffea arabica TaxID=13443 RepID=A0A6P6X8R8_COFAR|nr:protein FAR1-RELATED SEQUENCE 7-like [Coffea arabica]